MGPAVESKPAVVGRFLGVVGTHIVELPFPVEVGAVGAGVGVDAVQNHLDAVGMSAVHHLPEVLQRAQHRIRNFVVAGIIAVAGKTLGNGI